MRCYQCFLNYHFQLFQLFFLLNIGVFLQSLIIFHNQREICQTVKELLVDFLFISFVFWTFHYKHYPVDCFYLTW